ncbi:MAG TPA: VanZ family protein [Lysobacter sp.]
MSALRAFRWPWLWVGMWVLMIAAVVTGSLVPSDELPRMLFPGADKLQHMVGYATLSGYAVMLFANRRGRGMAALGLVLLGVLIEGAQSALTTSRQADPVDMLANLLGVGLGQALAATAVAGWLQRIDSRLARRF